MAGAMTLEHQVINPKELAPAIGFSHIVIPKVGRTVYFGGMAAQRKDGSILGDGFVEQFDLSLENLSIAMQAAGAKPEDLVSMTIYVKDADEYRASLKELGRVYQKWLGKNYPAMAMFAVNGFFDAAAKLEILAICVIPEEAVPDTEAT